MPFLVEILQASSIKTEYSPHEEALTFKIDASITKGMDFEDSTYTIYTKNMCFILFLLYNLDKILREKLSVKKSQ